MDEVHNSDSAPDAPTFPETPAEQKPQEPMTVPQDFPKEDHVPFTGEQKLPEDPSPASEPKSDEDAEDFHDGAAPSDDVQGGRDDDHDPVEDDSQQTEGPKPLPANLQTVKENEERRQDREVLVGDIQGGESGELREEDLPKPDDSHNEPAQVVDSKPTSESHRAASGDPRMHIVREPIRVDGRNKRTDDDGLQGHFVQVVAGDHEGLFGTFEEVSEAGKDGYPKTILVTPRSAPNSRVEVAYKDVRPAAQARR